MQNQAPLSPARVLYQELRENEDAGLLDTWPAGVEADGRPPAHNRTVAGAALGSAVSAFPGPEETPEPTPELATRRSSATGYDDRDRITDRVEQIHAVDGIADGDSIQPRSALAAIIRLQSTEIERLALDNDRLAARLDAVSQRHEDERNQRRNLDQQLRDANLRNDPPAPAIDMEEIRRAAREGMSAEIKPVLTAILDLLESTLSRGAETAQPTAVIEGTPVSASASLVAEVIGDLQRLPEILTRPIEELTSDSGNAGPTPDRVADSPARLMPRDTHARHPRPPRHEAQPSALPSVFAWTNLFS
ncbi:MAG: hypothetical protein ACTSQ7_02115 [Alphaproteobacteria bacterium]